MRIELQNGELALGPQNLHRLQHALAPIFFPAAPRDSKTPEMNVSDRDLDDKKNRSKNIALEKNESTFTVGMSLKKGSKTQNGAFGMFWI